MKAWFAHFNQASVKAKLTFLIALVFGALAVVTGSWVVFLNHVKVGSGMYNDIKDQQRSLQRIALLKSDLNEVQNNVVTAYAENQMTSDREETLQALAESAKESFSVLLTLLHDPEIILAVKDAQNTWDAYDKTNREEVLKGFQGQDKTTVWDLISGVQMQRHARFLEQIGNLVSVIELKIDENEKNAMRVIVRNTYLMGAATLLGVGLIFFMSIRITKSITQPLKEVMEILGGSAQHTSQASGQVSAVSQTLAQTSSQQAAAVEETTSSLTEISTLSKNTAQNAGKVHALSQAVWNDASQGLKKMEAMLLAMQDIKKASQESEKIIKTINDIAFQTNMLSLNAAVEAARVGELGSGFAVVASEVRNLARRCAEAAQTTTQLLQGAALKTESGVQITEDISQLFQQIDKGATQLNELVVKMTEAVDHQATGVNQINATMTHVDGLTQANASTAEETSATAQELTRQVELLQKGVASLGLIIGKERTHTHSAHQAVGPVPDEGPLESELSANVETPVDRTFAHAV